STALVLNQAMVDKLGWTPQEALGKRIELNWSEDYSLSILGDVVGVVANMRVDSLRREVVPLLYMIPANPADMGYTLVKIPANDLNDSLRAIDAVWREVY